MTGSSSERFPVLDALRDAARSANGVRDLSLLLDDAVGHMARLLGAQRCSILLVRGDRLRSAAATGLSAEFLAAADGLPIAHGVGTCGHAAAAGETTVTRDLFADPAWAPFHAHVVAEGVRSCWSVPLKDAAGTVLATFATYADAPGEPSAADVAQAEALAAIVSLGIESHRRHEHAVAAQASTIRALTSALDARDAYTKDHSAETAELACAVGLRLGLDEAALDELEQAAVLHDIGKLGIPNDVLHSPDPLTDDQWALMRLHPEIGQRILGHLPGMEALGRAIRHEHERWDGRGYPDGLAGTQIPLASRIVFACDAFHAMTSDRPYRSRMSEAAAVEEMRDNAGTQFDPDVVAALLDVLGSLDERAVVNVAAEEERARLKALEALALAAGAEDLFVFRRVCADTYAHVGGVGRGHGWAGNIEVDAGDEPHVVGALRAGAARCVDLGSTGRLVGPYYGRSAMIVPGDDALVVFGSSTAALASGCTEHAIELGRRAAAIVDEVAPAKRLADELEVLDAVRSITTIAPDSVEVTLAGIADRAAAALSCEFGAAIHFDGPRARVGWSERGWRPAGDDLEARLAGLAARHRGRRRLVQDADAARALLAPLGDAEGAAAVHLLPIGEDALLLVVHAEPVLRGFTLLCQRVAASMVDAAQAVVRRAIAQERLARENAELERRVRTDALTGALNRWAWDEIVVAEELHRSRHGVDVAIAVCDLDGLERRNDAHGHPVGDRLLRAFAEVLVGCARATDVVARVGGDEFAVLLRYCDDRGAADWCERLAAAVAERNAADPALGLSVSVGVARPQAGGTLQEAFVQADARMYAAKPS